MRVCILMTACQLLVGHLFAQPKMLEVGDQVPDIVFNKVWNYPSKTARLSDFRGKLVILDLWSTGCSSCIEAFPEMEELQKEFAGKIQVLLVNPNLSSGDSEDRVNKVLRMLKERTGFYPKLPMPLHDGIIQTYFPHTSVPEQVWIDGEGKVLAITYKVLRPAEKVREYFERKQIKLPRKDDWAFNPNKPLLTGTNGGPDSAFITRSLFTRYIDRMGVEHGIRLNENRKVIGYYFVNYPIMRLVNTAYQNITAGIARSRFVFEVKEPKDYSWEDDLSRGFCYDLTLMPIDQKKFEIGPYLKEDLKRALNVRVYLEKRKVPCLVVKATDRLRELPASTEKETEISLYPVNLRKYMHGVSIKDALQYFEFAWPIPVIDETFLNKKIDINFPDKFEISNKEKVLDFLIDYGFDIKEEMREIEMVIVTDK